MLSFDIELQNRLTAIREAGLFRELRQVDSPQGTRIEIAGRTFLNFSSNDYLGLANHPALKEAAIRAVEKFGAGAGASRLICGSLAPFHELEEILADFKGTEAALSFSTGYAAAIGTITALLGKDDIIVVDKLVHACVVDAARLSRATLRIFSHNDLNELEEILKWGQKAQSPESGAQSQQPTLRATVRQSPSRAVAQREGGQQPRVLIVTESVFSMDGDAAPLQEIVALKEKYGAWLMVDEAHATGLYGSNRRGLAEELGVSDRIEIQMGTLGKALGASGGYICGSRLLIDFLINRARSFIFSTAPVPAAAAAATEAIALVKSPEGQSRLEQLNARVRELHTALRAPHSVFQSAITPVIMGEESRAMAVAAALREQNIFVPAIRYPTVARGSARLRITLTASHTAAEVRQLVESLEPRFPTFPDCCAASRL